MVKSGNSLNKRVSKRRISINSLAARIINRTLSSIESQCHAPAKNLLAFETRKSINIFPSQLRMVACFFGECKFKSGRKEEGIQIIDREGHNIKLARGKHSASSLKRVSRGKQIKTFWIPNPKDLKSCNSIMQRASPLHSAPQGYC